MEEEDRRRERILHTSGSPLSCRHPYEPPGVFQYIQRTNIKPYLFKYFQSFLDVKKYTHDQYINIVVKAGKEGAKNTLKRRKEKSKHNKFQMMWFLTV